jgi:hypothetical protein
LTRDQALHELRAMGSDSWESWTTWSGSLTRTLAAAQQEALAEQGYASQDEALEATEADGTASVLDITGGLSDSVEAGSCWQVGDDELEAALGTARPTRAQVEKGLHALHENLGRGESLCIVAWKSGEPSDVVFAGWSYD